MREQLQALVAELVRTGINLDVATKEFERCFIQKVLADNGGNLSATARQLGIHRNTLAKKLEGPAKPKTRRAS